MSLTSPKGGEWVVHVEIRYIDIKSVSSAGSVNIGTTLNIVERVLRPSVPQVPEDGRAPFQQPPGTLRPPFPGEGAIGPPGSGEIAPPGGDIAPPRGEVVPPGGRGDRPTR